MLDYREPLRLTWTPEAAMTEKQQLAWEQTSLIVLRSVAALEETASTRLREEQPELHQELERLGAKLDLLLDMTGRLLQASNEHVAPRLAVMAVERLLFQVAAGEVRPGEVGLMRVYLHAAVSQPLSLPGRIVTVEADAEGLNWARFEPAPMSERLQDALGQHVFRHHRRMIAEQRARAGD